MPFFGQVWVWSLAGFLVGALLCWILIANPARKRADDLQSRLAAARRREAAAERDRYDDGADDDFDERPSAFDDRSRDFDDRAFDEHPRDDFRDSFEDRRRDDYAPVPALVPGFGDDEPVGHDLLTHAPEPARDDERHDHRDAAHDDDFDQAGFAAEHARLDEPVVDEPVEEPAALGSLDSRLRGEEPALASIETTQYIPAARTAEPADEQPGDWFADPVDEPAQQADEPVDAHFEEHVDEHLVDDLADADDPVLDRPADGGTIFTQHTTPIPAELIRRLDESDSDEPVLAGDLAADDLTAHEPAQATRFVSVDPVPAEATQFVRPVPAVEPEPEVPASAAFGVEPAKEPTVAYAPPPSGTPGALPKRIPAKPGGRFPFGIQTTTPAQPEPAPAPVSASVEAPVAVPIDRERSLFEPVRSADEAESAASLPPPRVRRSRTALKAPAGVDPFVPPGPFGPGSAMPLPGGHSPSSEYTIKASVTALRYCSPESPRFDRTIAEVWFRSVTDAERVGFRPLG
ncbi:sunset domain-containing protein [Actinokineospora sp. HUAS TT18]|uniref:sunset domain-containing protein n=1 Tax=Actinokineospora sp. HUAS TT18 TaxID=3447451 RepID=UPI003F528305